MDLINVLWSGVFKIFGPDGNPPEFLAQRAEWMEKITRGKTFWLQWLQNILA